MKKIDEMMEAYKHDCIEKRWKGRQDMIDFCMKKIAKVIKLSSGKYMAFDKPEIKTWFCYDDSYDYDGAIEMAEHARTSKEHFVSANLAPLNEQIELVRKGEYGYTQDCFNSGDDLSLCHINGFNWHDVTPFNDEDKELIVKALEEVRDGFAKRVNTYLKRYGLTKVRSWTYWGEA